jgi:hypothetical protein
MDYSGSWNGGAVVALGIVAALAVVAAMRFLIPRDVLRQAHDATGNMLSIVGTLYAVLLGLIVVDAMVRFERAMDGVQEESNCLADIFLLSGRLPEPHKTRLADLCRVYAQDVVDIEWPRMRTGHLSVEARTSALAIAKAIEDFEPKTEVQKAVFPMILEQTRQFWNLRRNRANAVQYGIPMIEWVALLIGAGVTLLFAGLFSVERAGLQYLLTAISALVIGLNLYLVSLFGYPFAGELSVSKRPFLLDIGVFEGQFDATPAHSAEMQGDEPAG